MKADLIRTAEVMKTAPADKVRIVCVSDTHYVPKGLTVPDGDVLVHAGDLTYNGSLAQIRRAGEWLAGLPHRHKAIIAGNHDFGFQQKYAAAREALGDVTYLQDSGCEIDGVTFWGSPWTPRFYDWAFQLDRPDSAAHWAKIPEQTDVLVTHGPPLGILDVVTGEREHLGDAELFGRVLRVMPRLHIFGHIHSGHGIRVGDRPELGTTFVNAAICDENYKHAYAPIVVELSPRPCV